MLVESDLNLYSFLQVVHCGRVDAVAFTLRVCFIVQLLMDGYGMYLLEGLDGLACWSRLDHLVLSRLKRRFQRAGVGSRALKLLLVNGHLHSAQVETTLLLKIGSGKAARVAVEC